jgi:[ribosomal protein S18]-alanine N-acetyltransferase
MIQVSNNLRIFIRPVMKMDQARLANILHFETHVHRHLDWISPLDLVEAQPFLAMDQEGKLEAALSCPIDPPGVAWIRLFVASSTVSYEAAWQLLWQETRKRLLEAGGAQVAAIALHRWLGDMLERTGFKQVNDVVFLVWDNLYTLEPARHPTVTIRPMVREDLESVSRIDQAAFKPIWRNSIQSLHAAYDQAHIATVAEDEGSLVAYQISTAGHMGGHLARLAVHPRKQGHGIGKTVLVDALRKFQAGNINRVTVNTQEDNVKSIRLYERVGFKMTGERYSVFEYPCYDMNR